MKKTKILVTGSAGFMGSHLVDALIKKGHQVHGIDNLSGGFKKNISPQAKRRFHQVDLKHKNKVSKLVGKIKPEVIYHLAATAQEGLSQFTPIAHTENNYNAYLHLLVPAIKSGLKRMVLFSSMAVYGDQRPPFIEAMPRKPVDIYGTAKAAMEQATETLSDVFGFEYVILRPHNVYGPRQNLSDPYRNVVAIFINSLLRDKPFYIYGDGRQVRSFSFIDDSIMPIVRAGFLKKANRETINIGPEKNCTINQLAKIVLKNFNSNLKPIYLPDRPREVKEAHCSAKKAEKLLGFRDRTSLEKGVTKMVKWAKPRGYQTPKYLKGLELDKGKAPKTWSERLI